MKEVSARGMSQLLTIDNKHRRVLTLEVWFGDVKTELECFLVPVLNCWCTLASSQKTEEQRATQTGGFPERIGVKEC